MNKSDVSNSLDGTLNIVSPSKKSDKLNASNYDAHTLKRKGQFSYSPM